MKSIFSAHRGPAAWKHSSRDEHAVLFPAKMPRNDYVQHIMIELSKYVLTVHDNYMKFGNSPCERIRTPNDRPRPLRHAIDL